MIRKTFILLAAALVMGCAGPATAPKADAVMDNILSRKSVRSYTDQKLSEEQKAELRQRYNFTKY